MPPLVNLPSPIYLSHTEPPFLYQYVGDQVKILKVLGDFPLGENSKNTDDQNRETKDKISNVNQNVTENNSNTIDSNIPAYDKDRNNSDEANKEIASGEYSTSNEEKNIDKTKEEVAPNDISQKDMTKDRIDTEDNNITTDTTSVDDASINDNDSAESDDEASFGTPDNSPKSKRKTPKGKYGKSKAPLPPTIDISEKDEKNKTDTQILESATSQESLVEIVNKLPKAAFKETGNFKGLQVVNPIAEKKRRHKSKSPGVITKTNSSGLSRLLQLPVKLAFWHKIDDKTGDVSSSRRSSNIDEFQSCYDLTKEASSEIVSDDDQLSHQEASDYDTESVSQEIIEKSDALQKTIEAKLESHPEYKTGPLHEIVTTSKSTDV